MIGGEGYEKLWRQRQVGRTEAEKSIAYILIFAPTLAMLLQLALSRTRAFDADLMAARLTGDSRGLASALFTIEQYRRGWLGRLRWMDHGSPYNTIWRTHPPTRARIRRLMAVADRTPMFGWRPVGFNRA